MSDYLINKIIVSVIIPAKNEEKYLPLCLQSLLNESYEKNAMEIILVDNGSTDDTVKIGKSFGCKVYQKPDLTIGGLRNFGARMAQGDILAFIDADCIADKGWIVNALTVLEENQEFACVTGFIKTPDDCGWIQETYDLMKIRDKDRFEKDWASECNSIIRKKVFEEVGGFSEHLITGEGVDLGLKINRNKYKIIYDKNVSVTHLGGQKTLKDFFKKERWRGYNAFDIFVSHRSDLRRAISFFQTILFILSFLFFLIFIFLSWFSLSAFAFFIFMIIPMRRTIVLSIRNNSFRYFKKLSLIWFTYYIARSFSLYDYIVDKFIIILKRVKHV